MHTDSPIADQEIETCVRLLRAATTGVGQLPTVSLAALARAAGRFVQSAKRLRRRRRTLRQGSTARPTPPAVARAPGATEPARSPAGPGANPAPREAPRLLVDAPPRRRSGPARRCYACGGSFRGAHVFYASLCPPCGEFHLSKRLQTADLSGRVALVTGARVTSGYATALKLLRAGATVIGTTRFPRDAAARFAAEPDFADWSRRVHLHGLDFRAPAWVEAFADHLASSFGRLHILVNNAAQTIRRPAPFHAHLVPAERAPEREVARPLRPLLASGRQLAERLRGEEGAPREGLAALFSQARVLPEDTPTLAARGEEVGAGFDRRERNSWVLGLGEVASAEALEALLVNAAAPFILTGRLREMMAREALSDKWVVHVTAVEGQLSRRHKDGRHPHLDMAKAALNMLTRTSSGDYARDRIFMNSVDVGWFSNGEPEAVAAAMGERGFTLPLDEVDAAARVCDPIFSGVRTGTSRHGQLLKNYAPHPW